MAIFFENPLIEGRLVFAFGNTPGATRYETWKNHLHVFQREKKKAVDFIYPEPKSDRVIFTEIKDFQQITRLGKYGQGEYGKTLADDIALKFMDSLNGFEQVAKDSVCEEEGEFARENQDKEKIAVFHWEMHGSISRQKRMRFLRLMTKKLCELLYGSFGRVIVENMIDKPSSYWHVSRIGE